MTCITVLSSVSGCFKNLLTLIAAADEAELIFSKRQALQHAMVECPQPVPAPLRVPWVLSGNAPCYGAATSQVLAIYENFQDFAVSVLLLSNSLYLLGITNQKKGSIKAWY